MAKKLTAIDWLERYIETEAAEQTAIVYTLEKRVYMSVIPSMKNFPVQIHNWIDSEGHEWNVLRLNLKQIDLLRLRDKGAACLGFAKDFFSEWKRDESKGMFVERKVIEKYHGIAAKPSTPYFEAGDAIIAGMETQIKYENGTLAKLETIKKAWMKKRKG